MGNGDLGTHRVRVMMSVLGCSSPDMAKVSCAGVWVDGCGCERVGRVYIAAGRDGKGFSTFGIAGTPLSACALSVLPIPANASTSHALSSGQSADCPGPSPPAHIPSSDVQSICESIVKALATYSCSPN